MVTQHHFQIVFDIIGWAIWTWRHNSTATLHSAGVIGLWPQWQAMGLSILLMKETAFSDFKLLHCWLSTHETWIAVSVWLQRDNCWINYILFLYRTLFVHCVELSQTQGECGYLIVSMRPCDRIIYNKLRVLYYNLSNHCTQNAPYASNIYFTRISYYIAKVNLWLC